ncbi:hypothetical protein ACWEDZ_27135 [Streptomyces sp. NPDC005047]
MDRDALAEATARRTAPGSGLAPDDVGRVIDALFGTVEQPGAIAEGLRKARR